MTVQQEEKLMECLGFMAGGIEGIALNASHYERGEYERLRQSYADRCFKAILLALEPTDG